MPTVMTPVLVGRYIVPSLYRAWLNRHQAVSDHHALGKKPA